MSIETPTFTTCKELNKYLQIETQMHYDKDGKRYFATDGIPNIWIPAPTLIELLRESPISIFIDIQITHYYIRTSTIESMQIPKSDNLTEAVAKIIIEYYEKGKND